MTICGVRPGMTLQQVLEVLGPPVSQGPEYPLREEEIDIWPIGWWLQYETECFEREYPAGHQRPHVGLDREGGRVIFIAGPSVERDGRQLADRTASLEELNGSLGARGHGWSADACYAYYADGVLVRGCGDIPDGYTFYLRDWKAQADYVNEMSRQRHEVDWARRITLPRKEGLAPPRGRLTMLGIYLGMTQEDLEGAGLPFERQSEVSDPVQRYDLGDPRTEDDTIRAALFKGRVVYIDGYRLERDGKVLVRMNSARKGVEDTLGFAAREANRVLLYPEGLLQVSLSAENTVFFLSLGVQPEGEPAVWPPVDDPDFSRDEIETSRRMWP